ncbi:hypothetical protein LE190_10145 [Massilia oculi]|uniref:DUF2917 domain-containing protein n=1 Tax=Massilia hydrophila TaxID=3044279 RepID=A0ABS7Y9C3_9BURK|nr:hypothetical protein [Massilia oculi]MCA1856285.1 hypothetical protein [Massilia oculi]
MSMTELDRRLQARLLETRRAEGDWLRLDDAVLLAALDGSRPLSAGERAALQASPLTARRLRSLALARRAQAGAWRGSTGMLRAADSGAAPGALVTDDGAWRLHFVDGPRWRIVLQLDPQSPLAPALLRAGEALRVVDAAGAVLLQGTLDSDGECEGDWPCADAPAVHLQRCGARFSVEPAAADQRD